MIDIFYLILFASILLLIIAMGLLIRAVILYIREKRNMPKNGTIVNKTIRAPYIDFMDRSSIIPKYLITVAVIKEDIVLNYTFEVDRQTYESYNIGDVYREVS